MKSSHINSKAKARSRAPTTQQAVFELKQRVVLALNRLADRDTHQIGLEELEKTAASLSPDGVTPFLSCVADTDSEQKTAVRRECVRLMGTLARTHGAALAPHLPKMVASIVKRLKDTDSTVRDACVEAVGILVTHVRCPGGGADVFVALARPLFEALGEQNRYVQAGSALCLARVIDEAGDPPLSLLSQMLTRVVKLLKNPHFIARPSAIELIRSIVQAGGATTEQTLSSALNGILEALKSNDWTTRKSASLALAGIAVSDGSLLGSFKTSCLRSLECCRFDKVKPVRDAIIHAIQCWKNLPGSDSPEPSEAGSTTKENFFGDYPDISGPTDGGWRDTSFRRAGSVSVLNGNLTSSIKKRTPLTVRETCPNYVQKQHKVKSDDWHIEISLPKTRLRPSVDNYHKESEESCLTNAFVQTSDSTRGQDDCDMLDDRQECSSISDLVSASFETKHVTIADGLEHDDSVNIIRLNHRSAKEEVDLECFTPQERKSLDSTVTDVCSHTMPRCCVHTTNELALIKKQLLEIEAKQTNLLDLMKVFIGNSGNSLSALQLKMHNLENAVDKLTQVVTQNENDPSTVGSKLLKRNQSISSSPRFSTSTPRPSIDVHHRHPSMLSARNKERWGESMCLENRPSTAMKEDGLLWKDPTLDLTKNPVTKGTKKSSGRSVQNSGSSHARDTKDVLPISAGNASSRGTNFGGKAVFRARIKKLIYLGDMEVAYAEVLCSGDDHLLVELMNRTGPVLGRLSPETTDEILCAFVPHLLDQKFLRFLIPWLQQLVDLTDAHEARHLVQRTKARVEFLLAVQEAATLELTDPAGRIFIAQVAAKLTQIWGEAPCRKLPLPAGPQRCKPLASSGEE